MGAHKKYTLGLNRNVGEGSIKIKLSCQTSQSITKICTEKVIKIDFRHCKNNCFSSSVVYLRRMCDCG